MKLDCDVIRDLLPLYAEKLASPASSALVEQHLAECEACRARPAQAVAEAARVLRKGGRLLLSSLARHEHKAVVDTYGHVNLGFPAKELRRFAEKAGLEVTSLETVTRERRPPHFEVISLIAAKS